MAETGLLIYIWQELLDAGPHYVYDAFVPPLLPNFHRELIPLGDQLLTHELLHSPLDWDMLVAGSMRSTFSFSQELAFTCWYP